MKTQEFVQQIAGEANRYASLPVADKARVLARAQNQVDAFMEGKQLRPRESYAKLTRVADKAVQAAVGLGTDPQQLTAFMRGLGLPHAAVQGMGLSPAPAQHPGSLPAPTSGQAEHVATIPVRPAGPSRTHTGSSSFDSTRQATGRASVVFESADGTRVTMGRYFLDQMDIPLLANPIQGNWGDVPDETGAYLMPMLTARNLRHVKRFSEGELRAEALSHQDLQDIQYAGTICGCDEMADFAQDELAQRARQACWKALKVRLGAAASILNGATLGDPDKKRWAAVSLDALDRVKWTHVDASASAVVVPWKFVYREKWVTKAMLDKAWQTTAAGLELVLKVIVPYSFEVRRLAWDEADPDVGFAFQVLVALEPEVDLSKIVQDSEPQRT